MSYLGKIETVLECKSGLDKQNELKMKYYDNKEQILAYF